MSFTPAGLTVAGGRRVTADWIVTVETPDNRLIGGPVATTAWFNRRGEQIEVGFDGPDVPLRPGEWPVPIHVRGYDRSGVLMFDECEMVALRDDDRWRLPRSTPDMPPFEPVPDDVAEGIYPPSDVDY